MTHPTRGTVISEAFLVFAAADQADADLKQACIERTKWLYVTSARHDGMTWRQIAAALQVDHSRLFKAHRARARTVDPRGDDEERIVALEIRAHRLREHADRAGVAACEQQTASLTMAELHADQAAA